MSLSECQHVSSRCRSEVSRTPPPSARCVTPTFTLKPGQRTFSLVNAKPTTKLAQLNQHHRATSSTMLSPSKQYHRPSPPQIDTNRANMSIPLRELAARELLGDELDSMTLLQTINFEAWLDDASSSGSHSPRQLDKERAKMSTSRRELAARGHLRERLALELDSMTPLQTVNLEAWLDDASVQNSSPRSTPLYRRSDQCSTCEPGVYCDELGIVSDYHDDDDSTSFEVISSNNSVKSIDTSPSSPLMAELSRRFEASQRFASSGLGTSLQQVHSGNAMVIDKNSEDDSPCTDKSASWFDTESVASSRSSVCEEYCDVCSLLTLACISFNNINRPFLPSLLLRRVTSCRSNHVTRL
jgi:hypothetical protein